MATEKKLRTRATSSKKQKMSTKSAATPPQAPAPLVDLVLGFLNEHGYQKAAQDLQTEHQQRIGAAVASYESKDLPGLTTVFAEWEKSHKPAAGEKEEDAEPMDVDTSDASSDSSRDSSSDSSSESEAEEETKPKETKSTKRKRSPSSSSSSSDSSSSSSSSDSESEADKASPSKKSKTSKASSSSSLSSSSSSSDSDDEQATATKTPLPDSDSSSASSSSDSSSSDSDSSSANEPEPTPKKTKSKTASKSKKGKRATSPASSSTSSDSSSSSDSSNDSSDSDDSSESDSDAAPAKQKAETSSSSESSSSDSDSSSSSSDSDSDSSSKRIQPKGAQFARKNSSESTETLRPTSPQVVNGNKHKRSGPAEATPNTSNTSSDVNEPPTKKAKAAANRFQRIPPTVEVDPRLASNEYVPYDYADKAHADLIVTRGKGFTKEKNKKKRGSYRGGIIDTEGGKGVKFED